MDGNTKSEKSGSSALLYLGIFFFPLIFYWFLLRKGHSITERVLWGIYTAFSTLFGLAIIGAMISAVSSVDRIVPADLQQLAMSGNSVSTQAPASVPEISNPVSAGQGFGTGQSSAETVDQGSAVRVSSLQLAEAFAQNEVAAQMQFKGKTLYVEGIVDGVMLDFMDNPVIKLEGKNQFMSIQAAFDKSFSQAISQVAKGQRITVICREISEVASIPMLDSCSL